MNPLLRLPLLALLVLAAGCLYRMPLQQGNLLEQDQISQLQTGMTRSQVLYLLGTPMVPPAFSNDRWDYYYSFDDYRGYRETRRLTVWFKDEKVERIDSDRPIVRPQPQEQQGSARTAEPAPAEPAG
jgi:outer membrane protein assembly factor BamE